LPPATETQKPRENSQSPTPGLLRERSATPAHPRTSLAKSPQGQSLPNSDVRSASVQARLHRRQNRSSDSCRFCRRRNKLEAFSSRQRGWRTGWRLCAGEIWPGHQHRECACPATGGEARVDAVSSPQGTLVTHATFAKMPDEASQVESLVRPTSIRGRA
jgi:hypothetical protein